MRRAGQHSWCWPRDARGRRASFLFQLHWREIGQCRVQPVLVVDEAGKPRDHFIEGCRMARVVNTSLDSPQLGVVVECQSYADLLRFSLQAH
jgi:hypothetical protein